ncbi:DUF1653 domain-containing protein [Permianibacter sp. IMCC34836]|uniref:DUF1653 domain-containing protein n=1 Tax=Permianibacter fluminis TaxID=2738515 RepID=UPI001552318B|nr:DUF1653 domain-containing protein [Permianibacter fluminis]NQD37843.1 DUF1653 domain-containing protein [Permianibacter fluminis]
MTTIDRLQHAVAQAEEGGTVTLSVADASKLLATVAGLAVDPPRRYRHYKGPVYELICEARFEADKQPMVVYRAPNGSLWIRYQKVFEEMIEVDGRQVQRFSPIEG